MPSSKGMQRSFWMRCKCVWITAGFCLYAQWGIPNSKCFVKKNDQRSLCSVDLREAHRPHSLPPLHQCIQATPAIIGFLSASTCAHICALESDGAFQAPYQKVATLGSTALIAIHKQRYGHHELFFCSARKPLHGQHHADDTRTKKQRTVQLLFLRQRAHEDSVSAAPWSRWKVLTQWVVTVPLLRSWSTDSMSTGRDNPKRQNCLCRSLSALAPSFDCSSAVMVPERKFPALSRLDAFHANLVSTPVTWAPATKKRDILTTPRTFC